MVSCGYFLKSHEKMKAFLVRGGILLSCALLLALAILSACAPSATGFGMGAFVTIIGLSLLPGANGRLLFLGACAVVVLRYLAWRFTALTLDYGVPSAVISVVVYGAELYTGAILLLGFFVNAEPLEREVLPLPIDRDTWPTVDVFIPTYSEPLSVVSPTVLGALEMRYPSSKLRVCVLDDGAPRAVRLRGTPEGAELERRTAELKSLCDRHGATYLTRAENVHAKSGNLNSAMRNTSGDLVLILDADHVPSADFLENTVGFFLADKRLALVQTPHFFINADPVEKNLNLFNKMPAENDLFYRVIQKGLDLWNTSFFCGSAAILRRAALNEIGGFSCQSITEDAATTVSLHQSGWNSVYFGKPMIAGLQPETFSGFLIQRLRWATGMTQIFLKQNPIFSRGLSTGQRLGYLSTQLFWLFPFARVVFFLAPVLSAVFRLQIYPSGVGSFLGFTLPYLAASFISSERNFGKMRRILMSEVYETLQAFYALPALVSTILRPSAPTFKVTPKGEKLSEEFISEFRLPFYCFLGLTLLGLGWAAVRFVSEPDTRIPLGVVMGWLSYNALLLMGAFGTLLEKPQRRSRPRVELSQPVTLATSSGPVGATVLDANELGVLLRPDSDIANDRFSIQWNGQSIPTRIVKRNGQGAGLRLAALYAPQTPEHERAAVSLAFGNSDVWQKMWEGREASPNVLRSISDFAKVAVSTAYAHFQKAGMLYLRTSLALDNPVWQEGRGRLSRKVAFCIKSACFVLLLGISGVSNSQTVTRDLQSLGNRDTSFADVSAPATLEIPMSPREKVGGAHLQLALVDARALSLAGYRLLIDVNRSGWSLQPLVIDTSGKTDIPVPASAFKPGTNEIRLALFGPQATPTPAQVAAPHATVDVAHSSLAVSFAGFRANASPNLAQINVAFDRRGWLPRKLIVVTGDERLDTMALTSLATVVQGVALRLGQVPLSIQIIGHPRLASKEGRALSDAMSRGADVLFFGRRADLQSYLPARALESIDGPHVDLIALNRGNGVGLVVTGRTSDEVGQAAYQVANRSFPFVWTASSPQNTTASAALAIRQALNGASFMEVPESDVEMQSEALELLAMASQWKGDAYAVPFAYTPRAAAPGLVVGKPGELGIYFRLALGLGLMRHPAPSVSLIQSSLTGEPLLALTGTNPTIVRTELQKLRAAALGVSDTAQPLVVTTAKGGTATEAVLWLLNASHLAPALAVSLVIFLGLARTALVFKRRTRQALTAGANAVRGAMPRAGI
jgi:cellulose synthase (UDP-forming)